jgi:competence protein ComEA
MYKDCNKININTSSVEALESLPDIGEVLAKRIVDDRPYVDVWELDRVKGIGPATIEAIENKVVAK